ncbi:MAG: hypothetical protein ACWGNI_00445 [Desulfobacterales bacterium]
MSLDIYLYKIKCEHCGDKEEVYQANITNNLTTMADNAGIYKPLWHPEECGIKTAKDLIEPLTSGINKMELDIGYYSKFNAPNNWGTYSNFLPWLRKLLDACKENPNSIIEVSI